MRLLLTLTLLRAYLTTSAQVFQPGLDVLANRDVFTASSTLGVRLSGRTGTKPTLN
ncbi:hypothetical protein LJY25_02985 [Hymenobacter sp. BT175]|uniref:hypothetical protein n=1 Tax=Hymenobacter translucens TaxID=2886507 RepID=UPI001D0E4534|nr:hypothetical protein [Hymenobacter translucens]MCC2545396.1 hypothetical protein [Hymenobacter translucens]